jgi:hypothetical protein
MADIPRAHTFSISKFLLSFRSDSSWDQSSACAAKRQVLAILIIPRSAEGEKEKKKKK